MVSWYSTKSGASWRGGCGGYNLMPRSYLLTRKNGRVNQVEFLRLAHAFVTGVTYQHSKHLAPHPLKETWVEKANFCEGSAT